MTYQFERTTDNFEIKRRPAIVAGDTWGLITIEEVFKCVNGRLKVRGLCACGMEATPYELHVRSGSTKSCGCLTSLQGTKAINNFNRNKIFQTTEQRLDNALFNHYKGTAKMSKCPFSISKEELLAIMSKPCTYCGKPPSNTYRIHKRYNRKPILTPRIYSGIDKVNPHLGYIPGNCVPCCIECNQAKSDMLIEEFRSHTIKIFHHWANSAPHKST